MPLLCRTQLWCVLAVAWLASPATALVAGCDDQSANPSLVDLPKARVLMCSLLLPLWLPDGDQAEVRNKFVFCDVNSSLETLSPFSASNSDGTRRPGCFVVRSCCSLIHSAASVSPPRLLI